MRQLVLALLLPIQVLCCAKPDGSPGPARAPARPGARPDQADSSRAATLRREMVRDQIEARGIHDAAVLRAMRTVPRHRFVADTLAAFAYNDYPLPIGWGQTISQPYIVAFMAQAADIERGERVLEIGTGSGYGAAVLAELGAEVYTIEILPELAERASGALARTGYGDVHVRTGDGWLGWPEHAPYDAIVVTAAPDTLPRALVEQLALGGVLVVPVGERIQTLRVLRRTSHGLREEASLPVQFVPMVHPVPDTGG